jgi:hypothetical protein
LAYGIKKNNRTKILGSPLTEINFNGHIENKTFVRVDDGEKTKKEVG